MKNKEDPEEIEDLPFNYGEYWIEGEQGEKLYNEAKQWIKKDAKYVSERVAKERCKEMGYSEKGIIECVRGVQNARFLDKEK